VPSASVGKNHKQAENALSHGLFGLLCWVLPMPKAGRPGGTARDTKRPKGTISYTAGCTALDTDTLWGSLVAPDRADSAPDCRLWRWWGKTQQASFPRTSVYRQPVDILCQKRPQSWSAISLGTLPCRFWRTVTSGLRLATEALQHQRAGLRADRFYVFADADTIGSEASTIATRMSVPSKDAIVSFACWVNSSCAAAVDFHSG
jgi:hypothetical protein